jgi:hypothetical protein
MVAWLTPLEAQMNRTVILVTLFAVVVGIAVGYFVMSSGGIVSRPGGGTMNTPQR